ncbi:unannotated protein [freshwater metagenome]
MRLSLAPTNSLRCLSSVAKWVRRRLSNALRAVEKRFHSASSVALSSRVACFHSSSKTLRRSPTTFHASVAQISSASTTNFSLRTFASARAACLASAAAALRTTSSSRRMAARGEIFSTAILRAARFPTALILSTCWRKRLMASSPSSASMAPLRKRSAVRATSAASVSNLRTK